MHYYEVLIADGRYHSSAPLTYSSDEVLAEMAIVSVPLRNRLVTGYITAKVDQPPFKIKPIKSVLSKKTLPFHCLQLAEWIRDYYCSSLGDALRQFAPSATVIRRVAATETAPAANRLDIDQPLTPTQKKALDEISNHPSTTVLLHGETGSGKTRVYLELAKQTLASGRSVIILVPEIALTAQMVSIASQSLSHEVVVLHSELSVAERKKVWFKILESEKPIIIIGPRSALFAPVTNLGLVVVDEAHEPAYKQEQAPRYNALRVASQLGLLTGSRVIMGSATPSVTDYYLAKQKGSVIEMFGQAKTGEKIDIKAEVVDLGDKGVFKKNAYLSDSLIAGINQALQNGKQSLVYYNRRGSARIILCDNCGWQSLCPNCDIPLVYHGDEHQARCHICGYSETPPQSCPNCGNSQIIYKSIGSKALFDIVSKLFPSARVKRFDSDNLPGERLNETYKEVLGGEVDILVGTQLLAKGLDLPKLSVVGVISAEGSLGLPDFSSEERTYQLLYQVIGRVGRGHNQGTVIVQTYEPDSPILKSALERDWSSFYQNIIEERQTFRFPPFSYLLKMTCKRATLRGAQGAAEKLRQEYLAKGFPVEVVGPTPSFYQRRGKYYYYQLVVKSKTRKHLVELARAAPAGWQCDLDPIDLL